MNPVKIKEALRTLVPLQQPVFIWGAPGVGKSQVVAQIAEELGKELIDVRAVLLDPVDLRGLPRIEQDGTAGWCPPSFLPQEGSGILFLDELNAAPPLVQAACYQLVLDRKLGEYELPEGWTVLAAGNREGDRAVTHRMPTALANRFVHLDFDVSHSDWELWAQQKGLSYEVTAFLKFRPALLHDFDPKKDVKAFPSPRSWEFAARVLSADPAPSVLYEMLSGTIGTGAATEFIGFRKAYKDLPDPEEVLQQPDNIPLPEDPATLYAFCEVLASKASEATSDAILTVASRLPAEFSVLLVRDSVKRFRNIIESSLFSSWAEQHAEVLV
ncbi:MAG: ATP-binding protein [Desulfovibrio sp.]